MFDASNYTITIRKGCFDGEICFEAHVAELPDVAEYADSYEEAYTLAIDTIEVTAELFVEQGRTMPEPIIPVENYSGRITLRLPKSLHKLLAKASENEGISLNQYLVSALSYHTGTKLAKSEKIWKDIQLEKTVNKPTLKIVKTSVPNSSNRYEKCA